MVLIKLALSYSIESTSNSFGGKWRQQNSSAYPGKVDSHINNVTVAKVREEGAVKWVVCEGRSTKNRLVRREAVQVLEKAKTVTTQVALLDR